MYTHIGYRQLLGNFFAPVSGGFETRLCDMVIRGVDPTARIVIPLPVRKPVPARRLKQDLRNIAAMVIAPMSF